MKVCIICEKQVDGMKAVKVKDDKILDIIRKIKIAMHIYKNNELYVCETDLEKHTKRRKEFQMMLLLAGIVAVLLIGLMGVSMFLSKNFNLIGCLSVVMIALLLFLLPIIKYTPGTETQTPVLIGVAEVKPIEQVQKPITVTAQPPPATQENPNPKEPAKPEASATSEPKPAKKQPTKKRKG